MGIAGGSGCGKTTLARRIVELSGADEVALISTDAYYRTLSEEDHLKAQLGEINFDRPEALDIDRLVEDVSRIRADQEWPLLLPAYDFVTHRRTDGQTPLARPSAAIVEGLFVLAVPALRELFDLLVFVKNDVDTCLVQRLRRDSEERGIPLGPALAQYQRYVKPAYDDLVGPSAAHADLVVPAATRNERAAELVAGWVASRSPAAATVAAGADIGGGSPCAAAAAAAGAAADGACDAPRGGGGGGGGSLASGLKGVLA